MRRWVEAVEESAKLYSPIGLRLVDDLTGSAPLGRIEVLLDVKDPQGQWIDTHRAPVITASSIVAYPGLERRARIDGAGAVRYRVRIKPEFYIPFYRMTDDAIERDAYPYNDTNPPAQVKHVPDDVVLTPAPNYPFEKHIPVLHGLVTDAANSPVAFVHVKQGAKERVLTDERGTFSLPLRWIKPGDNFQVDAINERNGQHGTSPNLKLPDALKNVLKIQIN